MRLLSAMVFPTSTDSGQIQPGDVVYETAWSGSSSSARRMTHSWRAVDSPRIGTLAIVHGLGEHAGRYGDLASHFVNSGFDVLSFDLQGHGQDPAARGVIDGYESLLDDVGSLLERSRNHLPGLPCFLLGHSMGGNLAINYVLQRSPLPDAVIASSPMFRTPKEPTGLWNAVARIASRLAPNLCIPTGIPTHWLTDNTSEQELVDRDPLYHRRVSLRLGAALIDSGRWAIANSSRLAVPTLITHGSLDRVTMPEASIEFSRSAGEHCQIEILQGHQHEAFRDNQGDRVIQLWTRFLRAQCESFKLR